MTNAITVDLHIHARMATFGEVESHTRMEILRRVNALLEELGATHQFVTTVPRVEIIERDE